MIAGRWCWQLISVLAIAQPLLTLAAGASDVKQASDVKLVVDDGRYVEEPFTRQVAVTDDDKFILVSDFDNGFRTFDATSGRLINSLEGHALPGDVRYDPANELFLTSGDLKVKVWDWQQQSLLKSVQQPFHSQYMKNLYVDDHRQYIYANGQKYLYDGGSLVAKRLASVASQFDRSDATIANFSGDKYYVFDPKMGRVRIYNCVDGTLLRSYLLEHFKPGINNYIDYDSNYLFVSYLNGVRIVNLKDGTSDYASFDRHQAYDNLDETSCYAISPDGRFLTAGSNQGVGLVVLRKNDAKKGFANNTTEVYRQDEVIGEVHAFHHSNKVVYTTAEAIHLLDLDNTDITWDTDPKLMSLRNVYLAPDGDQLYLRIGRDPKVNRHWYERTYGSDSDFDTYFTSLDSDWGVFKEDVCGKKLPSTLVPLWEDRARTLQLRLHRPLTFAALTGDVPVSAVRGTSNSTMDPVQSSSGAAMVYSPSHHYSVAVKDFGQTTIYKDDKPIGAISTQWVTYHVEWAADEKYMAFGGSGRVAIVIDLQTGQPVQKLQGESYITTITFSPDDEYLFTGSLKNEILMWRLKDGHLIRRLTGSNGSIRDTEITPDGKTLMSTASDGSLRFWQIPSGRLLISVFLLNEAALARELRRGIASVVDKRIATCGEPFDWVAVTPDGRFDSNNLDQTINLHWLISDAVLHPLPLEIFTRDYYEPGLLGKVLSGAPLKPIRSLQNLDLAIPAIEITGVDESGARSAAQPGDSAASASITVAVQDVRSANQKDSNGAPLASGAYDLRLFRDGQLVGEWPATGESGSAPIATDADLDAWRKAHELKLDTSGKATIIFKDVRLPQQATVDSVRFTAYAFNSDRVKSLTTPPFVYTLPERKSASTKRRVYLVTMAVNANQSHNLDLDLAVSSAERGRALLGSRLRVDNAEVVEIPLYSDLAPDSDQMTVNNARKADLKAVLDLLAGRAVEPRLREEVDPKHQLLAVTPDDSVVLYVTSHGYADPRGTFYLMPSDTGPNWGVTEDVLTRCETNPDQSPACKQAQDLLAHSVSSSELAVWWNGVDAGQMLMILDSCHSGAVSGKEFRPGPLGDPGFGQLSYDKGMRILSASQPARTEKGEWVTGGGGKTLLVDALETVAGKNPQESLAQWLHGVEEQLPLTAKELYPGLNEEDAQVPLLLDFNRNNPNEY